MYLVHFGDIVETLVLRIVFLCQNDQCFVYTPEWKLGMLF